METIIWVLSHKTELIAIIGGAVTLASLIVKMTPTPADDAFLAKIIKALSVLALNPKK